MILISSGSGLTATVNPERGGKIASLVDAAGIEWLAQADTTSIMAPGASFVDAEMSGWDECAPSIVACSINGHKVPDHGDLWNVPFTAHGDAVSAIGTSLGYRFERRITGTPRGFLLSYRAQALEEAVPFLWAAHPQFEAPPGTHVRLPPEVQVMIDVQHPELAEVSWSPSLGTIDSVPLGGSRKVYVRPSDAVTWATLVRPDGNTLTLSWSAKSPYLGLWFDNRAFSREPVIAIEPSTGYFDSLSTAISNRTAPVLEPGVPLRWTLELSIGRERL